MDSTITAMTRLQELLEEDDHIRSSPTRRAAIKRLRAELPGSLLRRFDSLVEHRRVPIAPLSESGACGSCHLKLPPADALALRRDAGQIHACPHCGRLLFSSGALRETEEEIAL